MRWSACPMVFRLLGLAVPLLASAAEKVEPARVVSEAEAWRIGWPMLHGPTGNLLPLRTGVALTRDLSRARIAWISEDRDFGSAKTGSQTFRTVEDVRRRLGREAVLHPGNWANVVVAEGRVFAASFRPTGPFFQAELAGKDPEQRGRVEFRLDAEDLVIALDARTGKTLWKAVEPGGWIRGGGKREGFQVAPCVYQGTVFAMGSTGRLFAFETATGRKLWQADIGPAHAAAAKARQAALDAAAAGKFTAPDGPAWFTSLVAAEGVLVAPTFTGSAYARDTGLRGLDAATGQMLWEVKDACARQATPALWPHGGRTYLLAATVSGSLRLIDPKDGRVLWSLDGLGPNYFTLGPSATHVMVNVNPLPDPKAKRHPGRWGAVRLSPEGGVKVWELPDEPANQIPTWFDACARQRAFIRDGRVYLSTEGTKDAPGRFYLLDEATGRVLAQHANEGEEENQLTGLFYVVEDQVLCRADAAHGASHGGRHPFTAWSVEPGAVRRLDTPEGLVGMDLLDFTTAYEVHMELPVVAGRMFERTNDGRLACYDLREPAGETAWTLELEQGFIGTGSLPVVLRTGEGGRFLGGRAFPPDDQRAGLVYGKARRKARWENVSNGTTEGSDGRLAGTVGLAFGTHTWPTRIELKTEGTTVTGTWRRPVPGLPDPVPARGVVSGQAARAERAYPTPWLSAQPWTPLGRNPAGTTTWVLHLAEAIRLPGSDRPSGLTLCLDHDGRSIVRAAAAAFAYAQSWHEVEASGLVIESGRLQGTARVVLNADPWKAPHPDGVSGIAGELTLDVHAEGGEAVGTYEVRWGMPWEARGSVRGIVQRP